MFSVGKKKMTVSLPSLYRLSVTINYPEGRGCGLTSVFQNFLTISMGSGKKKVVFWLNLASALSHPLKLLLLPPLGGISPKGNSHLRMGDLHTQGGRETIEKSGILVEPFLPANAEERLYDFGLRNFTFLSVHQLFPVFSSGTWITDDLRL